MRAIKLVLIIASLFTITACDDDVKEQVNKVKIDNPLAGHMKALEAAKDVERQILEADQKRRKMVDDLAMPGN